MWLDCEEEEDEDEEDDEEKDDDDDAGASSSIDVISLLERMLLLGCGAFLNPTTLGNTPFGVSSPA